MTSEETLPLDPTVFPLKELRISPDSFHSYPPPEGSAIIIDNGSYSCVMGWSSSHEPELNYRNIIARSRREKAKEAEFYMGNDIWNSESNRGTSLKSPFDRNVVTQFQSQEMLLDYGFAHLGINSEGSIPHPVLMSHPPLNPNSSQNLMNELLFECYCVPKVSYFIDALASYHQNTKDLTQDALIISLSHHTIHFIPWISGSVAAHGVRRINVGGSQLINFLHRSLQLKYPGHLNNITLSRAEDIFKNHVRVSSDYRRDLSLWSNEDYYDKNVRKIQLPFVPIPKAPPPDPEVLKQRRQELAKRLVEINAKKREEKLLEDEQMLKTLCSVEDFLQMGYEEKAQRLLSKIDVPLSEVEALINKIRGRIERGKAAKSKVLKEDEENKKEAESCSEPKKRREDMCETEKREFDSWLQDIKNKRKEILDKRAARQLRKQQLAKRRTAASQERMRMISQLAKSSKKDDTFGMRDEDWDVYKKINKEFGDSDSESEEQEKLLEYESVLREHDPDFEIPEEQEISHNSYEWHQLHLTTECIRVPEILFQPSIIGHEQGGISETLLFVLNKFSPEVQQRLADNIFCTGGLAVIPGLKERLQRDIMALRPMESSFKVSMAENPSLDAWLGARKMSDSNIYMTKAEYEEKGRDYFKEHPFSNAYVQRRTNND